MNPFSLFKSSHIKPSWTFSAQSTLWRLHFGGEKIIGEDRNVDTRSVQFFCLNEQDGKIIWNENSFGEQWWIGIEAILGNRLYLHGFKKPDMPEHKKIICADIETGNELWRNNDVAFWSADENFVFAFKELFERRVYYKLNAFTGEIIEEFQNEPSEHHSEDLSAFAFPQPLSQHSDNYQLILKTAEQMFTHFQNINNCEYVIHDSFLIINIYTVEKEQSLKNRLFVFNTQNKKQLFTEILNHQTPYQVPDSFFLRNSKLYFIMERKTLVAIQL